MTGRAASDDKELQVGSVGLDWFFFLSSELHLHLQLFWRRVRTIAHVLDGRATVFLYVRIRTVYHAISSQVVVTRHRAQHVHGPSFVNALVSWRR